MNINNSLNLRNCTSCQMCGAVCPTGAISISLNHHGFLKPVINETKCIDCGLCVKYCYKYDNNIKITKILESKQLYSAYAKNNNIVANSTSGGIATILVKTLIEKGYKCIGVEYDTESNAAVFKIASSLKEADSFKGSKYIQALSIDTFKQFIKNNKNEKFAVFGLPCHVYAIDRFLRANGTRDRHLLIDFYCHGCPSINLWHKYLNEVLIKENCTKVISANFRSKFRGWGNFYTLVVVEGVCGQKTYISPRTDDPFYTIFFSDTILNDSCYDCKLRGTLEYSDIRLGDFWGYNFLKNNTGISGVTICSEKGHSIFEIISDDIIYHKESFSSFIPFQSYGKIYTVNTSLRNQLLENLANRDISLHEVTAVYIKSLSLKTRLIFELKKCIKVLPNSWISILKYFIYKIKART